MFDLGDGVKAKAPSQTGVAGHDCNCRCFLEYNLLTVEEFEKKTGRKGEKGVENEVQSIMPDIRFTTKKGSNITFKQKFDDKSTVIVAFEDLPVKVKQNLIDITFEFGHNGSACDIRNRTIRVAIGAEKEEIFHEIGHLIENYMMDKEIVAKYKKNLVENLSVNDIIKETYYTTQGEPVEIFLLNGPNFETPYQSRLYARNLDETLNSDGTINTDILLECISEPFRKYMNGEKISQEILEIIERVVL